MNLIYFNVLGLLDPKWKEQHDRTIREKRADERVFAPGGAIGSSLKHLAKTRTDIFGAGDIEMQPGKMVCAF